MPTIKQIVATRPEFSVMQEIVFQAGVGDLLGDEAAPLTLFVPTDDAFAAFFERIGGTAQAWMTRTALDTFVKRHMAHGAHTVADLTARTDGALPSLMPDAITLLLGNGVLTLDDQTILIADVKASNGLLHGISGPFTS